MVGKQAPPAVLEVDVSSKYQDLEDEDISALELPFNLNNLEHKFQQVI
jgi:hypothetical protein